MTIERMITKRDKTIVKIEVYFFTLLMLNSIESKDEGSSSSRFFIEINFKVFYSFLFNRSVYQRY